MKKICIAGKNTIAVECSKFLLKYFSSAELCVLVNATDGGVNNWQPSFKRFALENGIDIYSQEQVYELENLLLISLEYDRLLSPKKFTSKRLYNVHFSLLPKYKGQYTSTWPILNLETESGVTLHKIDEGIDTGAIIDQIKFEIKENDTARDLYGTYLAKGIQLFTENFDKLLSNSYTCHPQPAKESSFYSIKSLDYRNIDLNLKQTAYQIKTQIRAFCFREYQLPTLFGVYVSSAEILNLSSKAKPGTLLEETPEHFIISTVDYDLKVYKDYYYDFFGLCKVGNEKQLEGVVKLIPDLETRNGDGWTGLMVAAYSGNKEAVEVLVRHGADLKTLESCEKLL